MKKELMKFLFHGHYTGILSIFSVTFSSVSSSFSRSAIGLSFITRAVFSSERVAAVSSRRRITFARDGSGADSLDYGLHSSFHPYHPLKRVHNIHEVPLRHRHGVDVRCNCKKSATYLLDTSCTLMREDSIQCKPRKQQKNQLLRTRQTWLKNH